MSDSCIICQKKIIKKTYNHKYCKKCAYKVRLEQIRKCKKGTSKLNLPERCIKKYPLKTICYFAGLLDGEGCIRIGKYYKKGIEKYRAFIQIGITNKKVIQWLKKNIGGNYYYCKHCFSIFAPSFILTDHSHHGLLCLLFGLPYLIIKQKQARLYFEFTNTQYTKGWQLGSIGLPKKVIKKRREFVPELGIKTIEETTALVKKGFPSAISKEKLNAEGIVARSHPLMLFRNGDL